MPLSSPYSFQKILHFFFLLIVLTKNPSTLAQNYFINIENIAGSPTIQIGNNESPITLNGSVLKMVINGLMPSTGKYYLQIGSDGTLSSIASGGGGGCPSDPTFDSLSVTGTSTICSLTANGTISLNTTGSGQTSIGNINSPISLTGNSIKLPINGLMPSTGNYYLQIGSDGTLSSTADGGGGGCPADPTFDSLTVTGTSTIGALTANGPISLNTAGSDQTSIGNNGALITLTGNNIKLPINGLMPLTGKYYLQIGSDGTLSSIASGGGGGCPADPTFDSLAVTGASTIGALTANGTISLNTNGNWQTFIGNNSAPITLTGITMKMIISDLMPSTGNYYLQVGPDGTLSSTANGGSVPTDPSFNSLTVTGPSTLASTNITGDITNSGNLFMNSTIPSPSQTNPMTYNKSTIINSSINQITGSHCSFTNCSIINGTTPTNLSQGNYSNVIVIGAQLAPMTVRVNGIASYYPINSGNIYLGMAGSGSSNQSVFISSGNNGILSIQGGSSGICINTNITTISPLYCGNSVSATYIYGNTIKFIVDSLSPSSNTPNFLTIAKDGTIGSTSTITNANISGSTAITGPVNINSTGNGTTTIGNTSGSTAITGPVNINSTGNGTTTIGNTSGSTTITGPVNINSTGTGTTIIGNISGGELSLGGNKIIFNANGLAPTQSGARWMLTIGSDGSIGSTNSSGVLPTSPSFQSVTITGATNGNSLTTQGGSCFMNTSIGTPTKTVFPTTSNYGNFFGINSNFATTTSAGIITIKGGCFIGTQVNSGAWNAGNQNWNNIVTINALIDNTDDYGALDVNSVYIGSSGVSGGDIYLIGNANSGECVLQASAIKINTNTSLPGNVTIGTTLSQTKLLGKSIVLSSPTYNIIAPGGTNFLTLDNNGNLLVSSLITSNSVALTLGGSGNLGTIQIEAQNIELNSSGSTENSGNVRIGNAIGQIYLIPFNGLSNSNSYVMTNPTGQVYLQKASTENIFQEIKKIDKDDGTLLLSIGNNDDEALITGKQVTINNTVLSGDSLTIKVPDIVPLYDKKILCIDSSGKVESTNDLHCSSLFVENEANLNRVTIDGDLRVNGGVHIALKNPESVFSIGSALSKGIFFITNDSGFIAVSDKNIMIQSGNAGEKGAIIFSSDSLQLGTPHNGKIIIGSEKTDAIYLQSQKIIPESFLMIDERGEIYSFNANTAKKKDTLTEEELPLLLQRVKDEENEIELLKNRVKTMEKIIVEWKKRYEKNGSDQ